jgi:hypothetical protein
MHMQTVKQWLESKGRKFPEPDGDDKSISLAAFEAAGLPMVVACTHCTMTMALHAERPCNEAGEIFCDDCAASFDIDEETDELPPTKLAKSAWVICDLCHGEGTHVNPSIDAGGLSREDFDDDPDFAEGYQRGDYDVTCVRCGGSGKVREADLAAIHEHERARADERRTRAAEDGDYESYRDAGDPRWG